MESGAKKHEVRVFDRDYKVHDHVMLRRWDPETKAYTGRVFMGRITHITKPGTWGLPPTVGVFSVENINQASE